MKISQKIIDYAIWYYLRYYPSPKKLGFKLKEKFGPESEKWKKYWWINIDEINFIINDKMRNIISEEEVIDSKIRNYKNKWKSKKYVIQKMFERMENKDLVSKYIEENFWEYWELENLKKELEKQKYNENMDFTEKQKIFGKILRKGYSYNELKKII